MRYFSYSLSTCVDISLSLAMCLGVVIRFGGLLAPGFLRDGGRLFCPAAPSSSPGAAQSV